MLYLARHEALARRAMRVVKVFKPELFEHEEMAHRFIQEVRITAALSEENPHIVRIYDDFGKEPDLGSFYVMEYLKGRTLDEAMKAAPLSLELVYDIFYQLCRAMRAAHTDDIVHRDLKPSNIFLIRKEDKDPFVKVIDFGIAKLLAGTAKLDVTKGMVGTPFYMAPEQCLGQAVDARTDIYAMGIILYEMLTGAPPFVAETQEQLFSILHSHIMEPPPVMTKAATGQSIPEQIEEVVMQALAKAPEERFATVEAFWDALALASPSHIQALPFGSQPLLSGGLISSHLSIANGQALASGELDAISGPVGSLDPALSPTSDMSTPVTLGRPKAAASTRARGVGAFAVLAGVLLLVAGVAAGMQLFSTPSKEPLGVSNAAQHQASNTTTHTPDQMQRPVPQVRPKDVEVRKSPLRSRPVRLRRRKRARRRRRRTPRRKRLQPVQRRKQGVGMNPALALLPKPMRQGIDELRRKVDQFAWYQAHQTNAHQSAELLRSHALLLRRLLKQGAGVHKLHRQAKKLGHRWKLLSHKLSPATKTSLAKQVAQPHFQVGMLLYKRALRAKINPHNTRTFKRSLRRKFRQIQKAARLFQQTKEMGVVRLALCASVRRGHMKEDLAQAVVDLKPTLACADCSYMMKARYGILLRRVMTPSWRAAVKQYSQAIKASMRAQIFGECFRFAKTRLPRLMKMAKVARGL